MSLLSIPVRQLLQRSTEELANLLTGRFNIVFDDGEVVETNAAETIYSSYIWDILRQYPETPVIAKHHIRYHLAKINFGSKTTINCYSEIMRSVVTHYRDKVDFTRDQLMRLIYKTNNNLYIKMSKRTAPWQSSLDILDFEEIVRNPEIVAIKENVEVTPTAVKQSQDDMIDVLMKSPSLDNNRIAKGVRSDNMSKGQIVKCIGSVGYITDIDQDIFPDPVLRSYAEGIRSIYDSVIESRSAAKALQFSKKPLQDTEYFSRRLQFITMQLKNLHRGDCGSRKHLLWYVRPELKDESGNTLRKGDLNNLVGTYYLDEETNKYRVLTSDDKHLISKTIKMRSVLHCNHSDPYGVCTTCFGELSEGVPEGASLGHLCAVTMVSPMSQAVLSTKHLDGTADIESAIVDDIDKGFIQVADRGKSYVLTPSLARHKPKLIIPPDLASRLPNLMEVDDVRELNITSTTEFEYITVEYYEVVPKTDFEKETVLPVRRNIPISIKRRQGSMTHEFLDYIKQVGWTYDADNNYIVDLDKWDYKQLFITLPFRHHSMADHAKEIEHLIESNVSERKNRAKATPSDILVQLFDLVNSKSDVNISILSVIVYTTSIVSDEYYDYSLPKESTISEFGVASKIMQYRSISAAMAFEGHVNTLSDPVNFLIDFKPNHPMDALVVPELMTRS